MPWPVTVIGSINNCVLQSCNKSMSVSVEPKGLLITDDGTEWVSTGGVYMANNSKLSTLPCRTLDVLAQTTRRQWRRTVFGQWWGTACNQLRRCYECGEIRSSSMLWLILSNAAEMSSDRITVACWSQADMTTSAMQSQSSVRISLAE